MRNDERYRPKPMSAQLGIPGLGAVGEADVNEAQGWIADNPGHYAYMMSNARRLKARNGWVSANYLVNMVRNERNVSIKNGLAPAFARIMERDCPDLEGAFKKHRSQSDGYV